MKRQYILLTLLLSMALNITAQIVDYQPLVRDGVRWVNYEITDRNWDHFEVILYSFEFHGETVVFPDDNTAPIHYHKIYLKKLYSFDLYDFDDDNVSDSVANVVNLQSEDGSLGMECGFLVEHNQVIYKTSWTFSSMKEFEANRIVLYDFSPDASLMVSELGGLELHSIPFFDMIDVNGKSCRRYIHPEYDYLRFVESVGYDGPYLGSLLEPNPINNRWTSWRSQGLSCQLDKNENVIYKGSCYSIYYSLMHSLSDVDNDGKVDVGDVNTTINTILGKANKEKADINGDRTIDIADINSMLNIILKPSKRKHWYITEL